ncbi:MAG TPA: hypothetical protein VGR37_19540 [Longimicrobiaceae bacterium]|nr:hypothetical protein [Longimicrobiaceae bacterium]
MRSSLVLTLMVLLPVTGSLSAQERLPEPAPPGVPKSASRAQFLSVAHTAVATSAGLALLSRGTESDLYAIPGFWLFAYGAVAAPSAGSFYARDRERTQTGLAIRSAGAALVVASAWSQILSPRFDLDNPDGGEFRWDALNVAGVGVMAAGAAYSIATAPASVERYNRRVVAGAAPRVSLSPAYAPATGSVGVHMGVRF